MTAPALCVSSFVYFSFLFGSVWYWLPSAFEPTKNLSYNSLAKKLSYRKQIARQLCTQYVEGIYSNSVTLNLGLEVVQGH